MSTVLLCCKWTQSLVVVVVDEEEQLEKLQQQTDVTACVCKPLRAVDAESNASLSSSTTSINLALSILATIVAEIGDNLSPNLATVAENGDSSRQCGQGFTVQRPLCKQYAWQYRYFILFIVICLTQQFVQTRRLTY